jgi:ferrochelatase
VLLNLGGPSSLDEVEPFLENLFSDREIIRLGPAFMQAFVARRIARRRAPKSREAYRLIGGGSPINRITGEVAVRLEEQLAAHGDFRVDMAMRYWRPCAAETLERMAADRLDGLVALSMYPHYSRATSGSSLADLERAAARVAPGIEVAEVRSWPDHPAYIEALAARIRWAAAELAPGFALVYSAHSLPVSFINEGDPYVDELKKTIAALEEKTGIRGNLCYQSRSGPVRWLSPSTPRMLSTLAAAGTREVLVVPISFVSDHVETLYEIDILYRDMAAELGMRLVRVESFNQAPDFVAVLADLVRAACRRRGWI